MLIIDLQNLKWLQVLQFDTNYFSQHYLFAHSWMVPNIAMLYQ